MSCPISLLPFVEPIMVPCCGNSFERSSMISWLNNGNNDTCPLCRGNLSGFDPAGAVINRSVLQNSVPIVQEDKDTYLVETVSLGMINATKVTLKDQSKDLSVMNVIMADKSGSMSGALWNACIESIEYLHSSFGPRNIYIAYDGSARTYDYFEIVREIANGGTSFDSAFSCFSKLTFPAETKKINIIFMTDGEDTLHENHIRSCLNVFKDCEIKVHAFGIGRNHKEKVLDRIRMLGTEEGLYLFANTESNGSEDVYNKIKVLADSCLGSTGSVHICGLDSLDSDVRLGDIIYSVSIPKTILVNGQEFPVIEKEELKSDVYSRVISEIASCNLGTGAMKQIVKDYISMIPGFDQQKEMIMTMIQGQELDKKNLLDLRSGMYTNGPIKQEPVYEHNIPRAKKDAPMYSFNLIRFSRGHTSDSGNNDLHIEALQGNYRMLPYYFNLPYVKNAAGLTPAIQAAVRGWFISMELLLEEFRGLDSKDDLLSAVVHCANNDYPKTATKLVNYCADLGYFGLKYDMFNYNGRQWFNQGVPSSPATIEEHIEDGNLGAIRNVDPNEIYWHHFHMSVQKPDIFLELLRLVPDISILEEFDAGSSGDYGSPVLFMCITKNKMNLFKALLEKGVRTDSVNFKGNTPIYMAVFKGNMDMLYELLDANSPIDALNWDNESPLMPACQYGHTEIVSLLLDSGLSPITRNKRNESPLSSAIRLNRDKVVSTIMSWAINNNKVQDIIDDILVIPEIDGFNSIMSTIEMNRPALFRMIYSFMEKADRKNDFLNVRTLQDNVLVPGGSILHAIASYDSVSVFVENKDILGVLIQDIPYDMDACLRDPATVAIIKDNYAILKEFLTVLPDLKNRLSGNVKPGTKVYQLFFDPLFPQISSIEIKDSVDQFFEEYNKLKLTKTIFGSRIHETRNDRGETWLHIAAKCGNTYLYDILVSDGFSEDASDSLGITPKFWAGEMSAEIKKHFTGAFRLLLSKKSSEATGTSLLNQVVLKSNDITFSNITNALPENELFFLRNYVIDKIILKKNSGKPICIKEIILGYLLDQGHNVSGNLPVTKVLEECYLHVPGTCLLGIGSEIVLTGKISESYGQFMDKLNNSIVYEIKDCPVFETSEGNLFIAAGTMKVTGMFRLNKYSLAQKNIRQSSYGLTSQTCTDLLVTMSTN